MRISIKSVEQRLEIAFFSWLKILTDNSGLPTIVYSSFFELANDFWLRWIEHNPSMRNTCYPFIYFTKRYIISLRYICEFKRLLRYRWGSGGVTATGINSLLRTVAIQRWHFRTSCSFAISWRTDFKKSDEVLRASLPETQTYKALDGLNYHSGREFPSEALSWRRKEHVEV